MTPTLLGIHHVTAIAGDAQRNVDFYVGLLGQRLVKRTVNFDDPGTYHFYYGDRSGHPGTILTFFPWGTRVAPGRVGTGQVTETAYAVPPASLGYWASRLRGAGVEVEEGSRFDAPLLSFTDADGLRLELVGWSGAGPVEAGEEGPIPAEYAIRGFYGASLSLEGYERTAQLLAEVMGMRLAGEEGNRFRFEMGEEGFASRVDLVCHPDAPSGRVAGGSVHHIAFRVRDDAEQRAWRQRLVERGFDVSPVMDRQYFHSVYFREPGGVLFELATDPPGFTTDETVEALGSGVKLPEWLEPSRARIEAKLPALRLRNTKY